ncbi:MAG TPA: hypothetical protein VLF66_01500, partial [Thermoanaerobaculia bacterium]|nr:hypothetical protein [Thermoanaerobaculia bacterium]
LVEARHQYAIAAPVPWPVETVAFESVPESGSTQGELVQTFTTGFSRDVFGRVLSQTRSDGEASFFTYDRSSQALLAMRTGAGAETSYARDGRGLPVQVTRPHGRGFTRTAYDLDGLPLVERTATADGTTLWGTTTTYDATGRPVARDYSDGSREERTYFPDSQVATITTRDGITLTYAYDPANRIESITPSALAGGTASLVDAGDAFAWDPLSRPTRIDRGRPGAAGLDPDLAVAYPSYDLGSRPGAEVVGTRDPLAWTWDVFGRPTEVRLPSGTGRSGAGTFEGFARSFDTLDRLADTAGLGAAGLSGTPLGADWAWGGGSRLYAMTTRGALGTAVRYGYHGGAGPQVPGGAPDAASEWKLGRMSWGAAGAAGPTAAPAVSWGSFGFGWRGHEGVPADGAKIGREVLGAASEAGLLAGLGWTWDYDAGVRLREAVAGAGNLGGLAPAGDDTSDRFTFTYGTGDELLERLREATGEVDAFTHGSYGRIESRDGAAFAYDPVGRRLEDDRFRYRWDWRGQLVEVEVRAEWPDGDGDGSPDVSPYTGHRVSYHYDARGRLLRRLHEGADDGTGLRPFIEERRYVWEEDRLAAEAVYGPSETGENLRWRKTYVPGPMGLDDAPQVVVEIVQPGSPFTGEARTYTYVTDELGTVVGLVAEDEGADPNHPPVPVRYRYTPYGEAHAETGPELLRARFDGGATEVETAAGPVTQTVADETATAPGGLVLRWSIPVDQATLADGLVMERLVPGGGWTPVPAGELAMGPKPQEGLGTADDGTELRVVLIQGWERATSYRVRLTQALQD